MDPTTGAPTPPTPPAPARTRPPSPLPPPPPRAPSADRRVVADLVSTPPLPGQLTVHWRLVTGFTWALVLVALLAVWKTSRELGLNTWWLGPLGEPQPLFVSMLPFVPPLLMVLLVVNDARWIPWYGLAASAALMLVAVFDRSTVPRLAVVELVIAGAGALISVAASAGHYREPGAAERSGR